MSSASRHPPPWLFGVLMLPYGIAGGFAATTMPFLARQAELSVEQIGAYGAAMLVPPALRFLYAPLVDLGPPRKLWLVLVAAASALCLAVAMTLPLPSRVGLFLALVFAGQTVSGLVESCCGGMVAATLPDGRRGAASGWMNVGNLSGGALGAWLTLSLVGRCGPATLGALLTAVMVLPALAAFAVDEPARPRRRARRLFVALWRDLARVARSRPGWTGVLLFLSPVGTAALLNFFSALAPDYHASQTTVAWINGPVNGLVCAIGSLGGGYLCDRFDRRRMYLLSGALTAACAVAMMLAPLGPLTYAFGVSAYLLIAGFCYAAFAAAALEAVGTGGPAASTAYTLFTSAGNCAIAYVGFIDTRLHHRFGARGLLGTDAALNLAGIAVLLVLFRLLRARPAGGGGQPRTDPAE
jgi:MFS family permease